MLVSLILIALVVGFYFSFFKASNKVATGALGTVDVQSIKAFYAAMGIDIKGQPTKAQIEAYRNWLK